MRVAVVINNKGIFSECEGFKLCRSASNVATSRSAE